MRVNALIEAVKATQDSIRSYDYKSQLFAALFMVSLGLVPQSMVVQHLAGGARALILVGGLLALLPVILFGLVIMPSHNPAQESLPNARGLFFVGADRRADPRRYLEDLLSADWESELAVEILKLSWIRDRKHRAFLRGLRMTGVSLVGIASIATYLATR